MPTVPGVLKAGQTTATNFAKPLTTKKVLDQALDIGRGIVIGKGKVIITPIQKVGCRTRLYIYAPNLTIARSELGKPHQAYCDDDKSKGGLILGRNLDMEEGIWIGHDIYFQAKRHPTENSKIRIIGMIPASADVTTSEDFYHQVTFIGLAAKDRKIASAISNLSLPYMLRAEAPNEFLTSCFIRRVGSGILLDGCTIEAKFEERRNGTYCICFYGEGLVIKDAKYGRPNECEKPNDKFLLETSLQEPKFVWIGNNILVELQNHPDSKSKIRMTITAPRQIYALRGELKGMIKKDEPHEGLLPEKEFTPSLALRTLRNEMQDQVGSVTSSFTTGMGHIIDGNIEVMVIEKSGPDVWLYIYAPDIPVRKVEDGRPGENEEDPLYVDGKYLRRLNSDGGIWIGHNILVEVDVNPDCGVMGSRVRMRTTAPKSLRIRNYVVPEERLVVLREVEVLETKT